MSWLVPRNELTNEQVRAVTMKADQHRAIVGGPGSGKTQILLYRAQHLSKTYSIQPDRYRVFVYTNVLRDYIQSAFPLLDLPHDNVLTFDHWCRLFHEKHIGRTLPWDSQKRTPDFAEVRRRVSAVVMDGRLKLPIYDFVLVDEGQDLDAEVYRLLTRVARHVTVCLDKKQQIYDNGSAEAQVLAELGIQHQNINLIDAFRVCPYLVKLAAQLIDDPSEREAFINQTRMPQTERQTPCLYLAGSAQEETAELARVVRERQLANDRIVVLLPQVRQVYGFAQALSETGIEVEVPPKRYGRQKWPAVDFNSPRPKVMPYHSVKGLTFDSVIMPRLEAASFGRFSSARIDRLLFVGITRATRWVFMSSVQGRLLPNAAKLAEGLKNSGVLHVEGRTSRAEQQKPVVTAPKDDSDDLDFL